MQHNSKTDKDWKGDQWNQFFWVYKKNKHNTKLQQILPHALMCGQLGKVTLLTAINYITILYTFSLSQDISYI